MFTQCDDMHALRLLLAAVQAAMVVAFHQSLCVAMSQQCAFLLLVYDYDLSFEAQLAPNKNSRRVCTGLFARPCTVFTYVAGLGWHYC
jgi:hypothetical protein